MTPKHAPCDTVLSELITLSCGDEKGSIVIMRSFRHLNGLKLLEGRKSLFQVGGVHSSYLTNIPL